MTKPTLKVNSISRKGFNDRVTELIDELLASYKRELESQLTKGNYWEVKLLADKMSKIKGFLIELEIFDEEEDENG